VSAAATSFRTLVSECRRLLKQWQRILKQSLGSILSQHLWEIRQGWQTAKTPFGWVKAAGKTVFWLVWAVAISGVALGFAGLAMWLILVVLLIVAKAFVWALTGVWVDDWWWS
jgi:hypothetical protein